MLLKISKTFDLARPEPWRPHWSFTKDEVFETDNEYLIDRLLTLGAAKILDKKNNVVAETVVSKAHATPKNKALTPGATKKRGKAKKPVTE